TSNRIIGMGTRIIPLTNDEKDEFSSGNKISKNQKRTLKRTQRKGYDRYQQRRSLLKTTLEKLGMLPDQALMELPRTSLWGLRARAASERVALPELGRVLLHLNQKRGYKSTRAESREDQ